MREDSIPKDPPPSRPHRTYKGREMTPLTLALLPLNYQQLDKIPGCLFTIFICSLLRFPSDRLRNLIKNLEKTSKKSPKPQRRSTLSTLNLLLALVYEKMRNPALKISLDRGFLTLQAQNCQESISNRSSSLPTAFQQLTQGIYNRVCLKNIPTLLLFNLIFGRSHS